MGFCGFLKQATAVDVLIGPFVDSGDGDSEETTLTIAATDVMLSANGQAAAGKTDATACAHDADGFYNCELDATDTATVGLLTLYVHVAGALAVRHDYQIIEENVYDAMFGASAALGTDIASILTDTGTTIQGELDGIQADTEDIQTKLGSPAGASVSADIAAVKVDTAAVLEDTSSTLQAELDGIQADTEDIQATLGAAVGATLSADIAAVKAETASILTDTGTTLQDAIVIIDGIVDDIETAIAALNDVTVAEINAELVDVLETDTHAELGQETPPATTSVLNAILYMYKSWRNKKDNDGSTTQLYADDGTTVDQKQTTSESAGTVTKGEWVSGP
jgi:hypothetical protein